MRGVDTLKGRFPMICRLGGTETHKLILYAKEPFTNAYATTEYTNYVTVTAENT